MKKQRMAGVINYIGFAVGGVLILGALISIWGILGEYHQGSAEYNALRQSVFTDSMEIDEESYENNPGKSSLCRRVRGVAPYRRRISRYSRR